MNPNTGQPIQDPIAKNNTPVTPEEIAQKKAQELQELEQGLGDIFSDDELLVKTPTPSVTTQTNNEHASTLPEVPVSTLPASQDQPAAMTPPQQAIPTPLPEQMVASVPTQTVTPSVTQPTPSIVQDTTQSAPQIPESPSPVSQIPVPVQQEPQAPISTPPVVEDSQATIVQSIAQAPAIQQPQSQPTIVQPQIQTQPQPNAAQPIAVPPVQITQTVPLQTPAPVAQQPIPQVQTPAQSQPNAAQPIAVPPVQITQTVPSTPTQTQAGATAVQPVPTPIPTISAQAPTQNTVAAVPGTPPKTVIKKGSKISPLNFAIGCGLFGFLLIGAVAFLLFLALQNPEQFQGIIGIEGIKTGLKLFAGLFFGSLFLGSFILIIFNLYKLINQKTGGKIKYVIGLVFGGLLLGGTVFGGIVSFNKINEIIQTTGVNNSLLIPYIKFKDAYKPLSDGFPIIAPTKILYTANETLLTRFLSSNFVNKNINSLKLDCGNDKQILNYNQNKKQFVGECLYMKKGDYNIKFITNISDKSTNVTEDMVTDLGPLTVTTEISLVPSSGIIAYNDSFDEIILGKAPTKVSFDSTSIFTDLGLNEYKIQWDLDDDGIFDKKDLTNFSRQFREPKVQSIYYTIPNMGNFGSLVYQIDVRVLQNDVPICTITSDRNSKGTTSYSISTSFDEQQTRINSYMYKIKNLGTNKFIETISNKTTSFDYDFSAQGNYIIYLNYVTEDGKQGTCESDTIEVGISTFTVNYDLQYKGPNDKNRKPLSDTGVVSLNDMTISADALPAKILLTINNITPQSASTKTVVRLDNQIIQTPNGKSYEITFTNSANTSITITVTNPITQATTVLEFPITITQEDIMGKLTVFPDSVGTSPLDIVLDASTTTLTDKDDEIIYFTWDYGDGEIIQNTSQARTEHTYVYDDATENGEYKPTVTITTKKGKIAKFGLKDPILVKKPVIASSISIDSHPAQIANVGDKVDFSLHTDGTPTHIVWDFGTNEGIECSDRSCAKVPMFFTNPGTYTITATITYKDLNSSSATTKLVVEK